MPTDLSDEPRPWSDHGLNQWLDARLATFREQERAYVHDEATAVLEGVAGHIRELKSTLDEFQGKVAALELLMRKGEAAPSVGEVAKARETLAKVERFLTDDDVSGFAALVRHRHALRDGRSSAIPEAALERAQSEYRSASDRLRGALLVFVAAPDAERDQLVRRCNRLLKAFGAHWSGGTSAVAEALIAAGVCVPLGEH